MKRARREAAKEHYEKRREARSVWSAKHTEEEAKKKEAVRAALEQHAGKHRRLPDVMCTGADLVFNRAPRLRDKPYEKAVGQLLELSPVRSLASWEPRGKGRDTLFRSLAEHLLAKYTVPSVLWSGFFEDDVRLFKPMIAHVAGGGSLYDFVKSFPIPLTRKMCHDLLATSSEYRLLRAIRRVEVRAAGGDNRLLDAWMGTHCGRTIQSREDETFWLSVLAFLAKNPMLEPSHISPLVDYIAHRRREDANFSMKGRSVLALLHNLRVWHNDLATEKIIKGISFKPSGFSNGEFDHSHRDKNGDFHKEIWRVKEILTSKELAAEGRRMAHCVYSYASSVEKNLRSIWSMTMENGLGETGVWAILTIEVHNETRRVVQARGRFNQPADSKAHRVLVDWAGKNNFELSLGRW